MNDSEFERLLSQPLAGIADGGFSQSLSRKIVARTHRDSWIETGAILAALAIFAAFAPVQSIQHKLETAGNTLATSVPLAIACAVLALTYAAYRLLEDRELF